MPNSTANRSIIVSDDSEQLILVDANDQPIGTLDKRSCHNGAGQLHRAFSLFVFNAAGHVLLQQRASGKRLWPGYWANACCSHPREGEVLLEAVQRRSQQELGIQVDPTFLYKFEYHAEFEGLGSEHELCSVFAATYDGTLAVNQTEIADWQWIDPADLTAQLQQGVKPFTPWLRLEWQRLRADFPNLINSSV